MFACLHSIDVYDDDNEMKCNESVIDIPNKQKKISMKKNTCTHSLFIWIHCNGNLPHKPKKQNKTRNKTRTSI